MIDVEDFYIENQLDDVVLVMVSAKTIKKKQNLITKKIVYENLTTFGVVTDCCKLL